MGQKKQATSETPLMKQYYNMKTQYPDALLLFRVGDFYETFGEDAVKASQILGITLTKRSNGKASDVELAGFPHHALETYLPKLIQSGLRVAVCDQLEDPKKAKKLVKRGITELVSPGTSLHDRILDHDTNNFLAAINFGDEITGLALLDLSTGEFIVTQGPTEHVETLVKSLKPSEILFSKAKKHIFSELFDPGTFSFMLEDWLFTYDFGYDKLINHFQTQNLKGFGIEELKAGIGAAGVILHYLEENKHQQLSHISKINRLDRDNYVWLDQFTINNLELIKTPSADGTSLFQVIDRAETPMGSRLLRKWLLMPSKNLKNIQERQDLVEFLMNYPDFKEGLKDNLAHIGDLERLISKAAMRRINPREVIHLKKCLFLIEDIQKSCTGSENKLINKIGEKLQCCESLRDKIEKVLIEEPPVQTNKGGFIKDQVSEELDQYREIAYSGKDYLLKLQKRETEKTGIPSLKIAYNNVFGYYLEVRNTHKNKVPQEWVRKQTLVNAERYITQELKEYEEKILSAEEKIYELENQIYQELLQEINLYIEPVQDDAHILAFLDGINALATVALEFSYIKPEITDDLDLDIKAGRHPVIEQKLPPGESFVPNDIYLDNESQQVIILTGPNMSGKSAVLRQTALITILAQIGSFIPAASARIGLVDKIFTRVGASDNLSRGESTFMVEMTEAASILNNISSRSLILLDEIGRGTATYDGVSIAWAITEYIHEHKFRPKTLFATHYHELNDLSETFKRITNFHISVKEYQNKIIFLRKLVPGGSEHSFGIHVAQMAGMPDEVINRAQHILDELESQRGEIQTNGKAHISAAPNIQLSLFEMDDPVLIRVKEELEKTDINAITPVEAMMKLNHLKSLLKKAAKRKKEHH